VLTLALGIGANTSLFSVVSGVLLHPLPFPDSDRLYSVYTRTPTFGNGSIAYANFLDWQKDNRVFTALGAYRPDDFNLAGSGEAERVQACMVSAELLPLLGVKPLVGRTFLAEEDRPGAGAVAVLGDGLWKRRFGALPEVVGRSITLNGKPHTIVGVAPSRLTFTNDAEVYVPIGQWTDETFRDRRVSMGTRAVGRLRPGVTAAQSRANMDRIARDQEAAYPDANKGRGIALVSLKEDVVGGVQGMLLVLLGAVSFVLLIACRERGEPPAGARDRTQPRVRAASGSRRERRPGRPAAVDRERDPRARGRRPGNAAGEVGHPNHPRRAAGHAPSLGGDRLSVGVLVFTLAISVLTGIVFGLAPALKLLRSDLQETLKEGGRGSSGARHRAQSVFCGRGDGYGAGAPGRSRADDPSLQALWAVNPGFEPKGVLTFSLSLTPVQDLSAAQLRAKYREALRQFQGVREVTAVSLQADPCR
jgi:hypothetical protein